MPTYVDTSFGDKFIFDGSVLASDKCCGGIINVKITLILPGGTFRTHNIQIPARPDKPDTPPTAKLTKPIPIQVLRTKCKYRSQNPIEFGHGCCDGKGDVFDCEIFERCVIARSSKTNPTFPSCSDCEKFVAESG
jgi:hypothetical protein